MFNIKYRIILPTNVKYLDVVKNYIELLRINWPEAYKKLIISTTGSDDFDIGFTDIPVIKNGISTSLPTCVYNAASKYKADYYFIFLGDAFISQRISNEKVEKLLSSLIRNSINYCRLLPQFSLRWIIE